ncbi:MAE_28990/MAE_18760 family HEPN-like nuclease [Roseofilum sp. BLCC_M91]|uniref:MAE_28990/MAE_18760 family HEPN-like nuclease n=1 Tax=Roseofilum halophilum BLCC-M91 TaxID=3022259 RepID=A0ABT7BMZ9_9CYAN|nr:MAE_28990/MAE_18760 family HEPN-like nuclease [Roseofilum halophilum]MDJ1180573.1 MAE_28990/MAE_18760 family HEPN-like nuclease [Roseofilum halophilum BLCC-M91]
MQTVLLDFQTRVQEVNQYFEFLEGLIQEKTKLVVSGDKGEQKIITINPDLAKIFKANAFLILYNLVESTMRNAIEAIFDEISSKNISYNLVRVEIKKIVIHNFKNRSPDNVHSKMKDISLDIITAGLNRRELFSGNVDRDEITKTARKYGFSFDTDYSKTKHGEHLYDIMQHRNDLAHGNKSFAEIGQKTSIEDLLKVKEEVIEYLQQILQNIQDYLENQEYLDNPIQAP